MGKRDAALSGASKAKPKPDIAIPKGSADDSRATPLERTIAALAKLDFTFTYDLFRHQYHVGDHALQQRIGENVEHAILVLRTTVVNQFKFDPGPEKIKAAVYRLCINNSFNPVLDYLDRLEWDGKRRLDTWLSAYLGAKNGRLNRAIGRKVLLAAVRACGCPAPSSIRSWCWKAIREPVKPARLQSLPGIFSAMQRSSA